MVRSLIEYYPLTQNNMVEEYLMPWENVLQNSTHFFSKNYIWYTFSEMTEKRDTKRLLGSLSPIKEIRFFFFLVCFLITFKYFIHFFCNPDQNGIKKWTANFAYFLNSLLRHGVFVCVGGLRIKCYKINHLEYCCHFWVYYYSLGKSSMF